MAVAQATCAQASSRSPSGRTRRIPGCTCQSWLRQAKAGRLEEAEGEKKKVSDLVCFTKVGYLMINYLFFFG